MTIPMPCAFAHAVIALGAVIARRATLSLATWPGRLPRPVPGSAPAGDSSPITAFGRVLAGLCLLALFASATARAHKASDAYVQWQVQAQGHGLAVAERVDIAVLDLARELSIEGDGGGVIRWGDLRARAADVENLWRAALDLQADGRPCQPGDFEGGPSPADRLRLETRNDGPYAVLSRHWWCGEAATGTSDTEAATPDRHGLEARYRLFAGSDPTHRGLVRIDHEASAPGGGPDTITGLLKPDGQPARWQWAVPRGRSAPDGHEIAGPSAAFATLWRFAGDGMHHIAIGLDHLAFLLTLLLVAVYRRDPQAGWVAQTSVRATWLEAARLVTAFTVAHSLTLGLAASGWLHPPSWLVESLIAASVLVAALDNLRPALPGPRWVMAAGFGLVHGLGFAGPLQSLGLSGPALLLPLLGFNLGVEAGQLTVVVLVLPMACMLRGELLYGRAVVGPLSAAIAGLSLTWLFERLAALDAPVAAFVLMAVGAAALQVGCGRRRQAPPPIPINEAVCHI